MTESADITSFVRRVRFDAAHPSFAGHFPGRPIVAGVLLIEAAALALRDWRGLDLRQVVDAKFVAPLLPDQDAEVELVALDERRFRFAVRRGADLLVRGTLEAGA